MTNRSQMSITRNATQQTMRICQLTMANIKVQDQTKSHNVRQQVRLLWDVDDRLSRQDLNLQLRGRR